MSGRSCRRSRQVEWSLSYCYNWITLFNAVLPLWITLVNRDMPLGLGWDVLGQWGCIVIVCYRQGKTWLLLALYITVTQSQIKWVQIPVSHAILLRNPSKWIGEGGDNCYDSDWILFGHTGDSDNRNTFSGNFDFKSGRNIDLLWE